MSQTVRSTLVLLVGVVGVAFAANLYANSPSFQFPKDFLEYWASGRLSARGENPYDPAALLAEQRTAQPDRDDAVMMWNPPPALAVYMPLGLLPARWAALLWVAVQFGAVMLAAFLLVKEYAPGRTVLAPCVALTSVGTWWVISYGQNTGLLALGLAGFLHFTRREKPLAAGACAALTALKPHLLAGFGVLLIADAMSRKGRGALAAGVGVIALSLGIAVLANPSVVQQFVAAVRNPGPHAVPLDAWALPVPAYWLRVSIDPTRFWIQFVPWAAASIALVAWRFAAGTKWDWRRALPLVVAVSVMTTPYGGWIFDLPVLLVPSLWCIGRTAAGGRGWCSVAFLAGQLGVTAVSLATPGALEDYWWVAPASLALCLLAFTAPPSSYTTPAPIMN